MDVLQRDDERAILAALDRVLDATNGDDLPAAVVAAVADVVEADSVVLAAVDRPGGYWVAASAGDTAPTGEHRIARSFVLLDGRTAFLCLARSGRPFSAADVRRVDALSARVSALSRLCSGVRQRPARDAAGGRLTPSEERVLACVADGLTDRAVARRLGIAEGTVRKHLEHSYRKLGVSNRVAATVIWLDGAAAP